ncbi:TraG family conjugative transposon ATPase [Mucilaginibacter corticis]|uniref:TraG family conjugative transposon ATPase n=1 Tax=Mucilaginibacter corticis TaxID=2597670 RepID=A0A556MII0_9SPHI|nr:TraG family conjugative transposon ATPase [Mucilaginibacter corticis]TSJ39720.1 TraG family conjugative transposon ATPase [Mucilaginibacter corticis]
MAGKTQFEMPFIGVDTKGEYDLLIGAGGDYSVILKMTNPVIRYSAYPAGYDEFHHALINVVKVLGDGYLLQKQDIISRTNYHAKKAESYLQQRYNAHFEGREFMQVTTYLTITKRIKKNSFYVFDPKSLREFRQAVVKVLDILTGAIVLKEAEINLLLLQVLSMDFSSENISLNNLSPNDNEVQMGEVAARSISLVNIDSVDLPPQVATHIEMHDKESLKGFPLDLFAFLFKVPGCRSIVYNQVIDVIGQPTMLRKLEQKKKRHSGIPDPANDLCVEDIDLLLNDVARENQLVVNCHFNMLVVAPQDKLDKAANFIESSLFNLGIQPSKSAYNQLELFRSAIPGNAVELKEYDWFLTTSDAAACFFFKESLQKDEPSDFLIRFTDRQGIPVGMDPADLPMRTGRINNRNKFVLGPSGSGKSFFMNALVEQYIQYRMDVVIIDVGHSYSGLCAYFKGKYITYTDQKPITMNPFAIKAGEYNIEKKDFLITLIGLLWKGADGTLSTIERDVLSALVSAYYTKKFNENAPELNFNTFYEYALDKIPEIKREEAIPFDLEEFRYVLKKFYRGGEFEAILNEAVDDSLFEEPFIVYEIDNVQNHKILFPIVTLIIMDVFIQKMRYRTGRRKCLIAEEAWKAIASPIMASYLVYLYKTVRKFWGEAIVVTQELGDILGNPIVKDSIISNSDTICLLDQTKFRDNYNEIAALLSINEIERRKIFTINQLDNTEGRGRFKEVYMRRGAVGEVYGVEVSLEQYLTFSTEKPEKSAIEIYAKNYGSYPGALDAFVRDLKASNLSLPAFINQVNSTKP